MRDIEILALAQSYRRQLLIAGRWKHNLVLCKIQHSI